MFLRDDIIVCAGLNVVDFGPRHVAPRTEEEAYIRAELDPARPDCKNFEQAQTFVNSKLTNILYKI